MLSLPLHSVPTFPVTTVPKGSCFLDSTVRTLKICVARVKGRLPTFLPTVVSAAQLCTNAGISLDTKMSQKATVKKIKRKVRRWETLLPRRAQAIRRQSLQSLADNVKPLHGIPIKDRCSDVQMTCCEYLVNWVKGHLPWPVWCLIFQACYLSGNENFLLEIWNSILYS